MVKKNFMCFMAAVTALSVLLCGCEKENCGDVILIGSAGTVSSAPLEEGDVPWLEGFGETSGTPGNQGASENPAAPEDSLKQGQPEPSLPMICVYVCGAVACPGVVEIPQGSRIEDALFAAGGFLPDALTEAVNLADWAIDGQMLYFPTEGEAAAWKPVQESQGSQDEQGKLVNINTAGAALLCTLPGIGEAKAADIIVYREAHGSFASCEDIMQVPGIKTNIYEKICDKITVK